MAIFDIANHLSHKWKKPDYYLNYACAIGYQQPVEFEYTFDFRGHKVNYNYGKVASELKGIIIYEQLNIDGVKVINKDKYSLYVTPEFGLSEMAIRNLKESANNISIVNYLLGAVPFTKEHPMIYLQDFVEKFYLIEAM